MMCFVSVNRATPRTHRHEEYARTNHSYRLGTLRERHVRVRDDEIRLRFRDKSGIECKRCSMGFLPETDRKAERGI